MTKEILHGRLGLLLLKVLSAGPAHGLAVRDAIGRLTGGEIHLEPSALYPALHRLHADGLLSAEWGLSEKQRRAKFYSITTKGRAELESQESSWGTHVRAVQAVLEGGAET